MYDCHPQPLHQLPFDQGVEIVISPSLVVYVPELFSHLAVFCIDRNAIGYDYVRINRQISVHNSYEWCIFNLM